MGDLIGPDHVQASTLIGLGWNSSLIGQLCPPRALIGPGALRCWFGLDEGELAARQTQKV